MVDPVAVKAIMLPMREALGQFTCLWQCILGCHFVNTGDQRSEVNFNRNSNIIRLWIQPAVCDTNAKVIHEGPGDEHDLLDSLGIEKQRATGKVVVSYLPFDPSRKTSSPLALSEHSHAAKLQSNHHVAMAQAYFTQQKVYYNAHCTLAGVFHQRHMKNASLERDTQVSTLLDSLGDPIFLMPLGCRRGYVPPSSSNATMDTPSPISDTVWITLKPPAIPAHAVIGTCQPALLYTHLQQQTRNGHFGNRVGAPNGSNTTIAVGGGWEEVTGLGLEQGLVCLRHTQHQYAFHHDSKPVVRPPLRPSQHTTTRSFITLLIEPIDLNVILGGSSDSLEHSLLADEQEVEGLPKEVATGASSSATGKKKKVTAASSKLKHRVLTHFKQTPYWKDRDPGIRVLKCGYFEDANPDEHNNSAIIHTNTQKDDNHHRGVPKRPYILVEAPYTDEKHGGGVGMIRVAKEWRRSLTASGYRVVGSGSHQGDHGSDLSADERGGLYSESADRVWDSRSRGVGEGAGERVAVSSMSFVLPYYRYRYAAAPLSASSSTPTLLLSWRRRRRVNITLAEPPMHVVQPISNQRT